MGGKGRSRGSMCLMVGATHSQGASMSTLSIAARTSSTLAVCTSWGSSGEYAASHPGAPFRLPDAVDLLDLLDLLELMPEG